MALRHRYHVVVARRLSPIRDARPERVLISSAVALTYGQATRYVAVRFAVPSVRLRTMGCGYAESGVRVQDLDTSARGNAHMAMVRLIKSRQNASAASVALVAVSGDDAARDTHHAVGH